MTIPDSGLMMDNGASCLPIPPEEEKRIVEELTNKSEANLKEGNLYYVISNRWYSSWQRYVLQSNDQYLNSDKSLDSHSLGLASPRTVDRPGPIDNSDIVFNGNNVEGDDLELHRMIEEGRDYVLVPQEVWEKLFGWYRGGPAIPRKMICSQGVHQKSFNVEVYLLCLKVVDSRDNSQSIIRLSKKTSIEELYQRVCTIKGLDIEKVHIWDYFNEQKGNLLARSTKTLDENDLQMDQYILLEVQDDGVSNSRGGMDSASNDLALVALEPSRSSMTIAGGPTMSNGHSTGFNLQQKSSLSSTSSHSDDAYDLFNSTSKGERRGLAGLQNLGNTCFMNSAIQCLVHTTPIVEYFLQEYVEDINKENPLGMRGELALAFGDLLRKLWSSQTSIAPRIFKGKLGRFAPQFSGYSQHDSQELLAFLLDGLHEDLNRVKRKPYIEMKDSDGRPDEEVADESWRYHKARNDSIIVDVCQGQYKSTLVCPICGKISITFDPFMYLTLPLPSSATRTMTVTVFYSDGSGLPMPYTVSVLKHGNCKDLNQALATACCLKLNESLLLAEVYEHKIYRYLDNSMDLSQIKDDDYIVAYRLPTKGAGKTRLEIMHRSLQRSTLESLKGHDKKLFGTPLVTFVGEDSLSGVDIEMAVSRIMTPLRRYSSSKIEKENGILSKDSNDLSGSSSDQSGHMDNEMMDSDEEDVSSRELSLQLSSVDDNRGLNAKPLHRDSVVRCGQIVKVMLDWTDKEYESYDASYLKDLPEVHKSGFTVKKTKQEAISLFSCLDAFLKEEPLGPDDMWYCPSCKEHRQATKKLDLWKLPDILVVHLKRFSYSRFLKNKLDTFVNFPVHNLDLTKYVKSKDGQSYIYELYAISNHYGGLGGGHYTAYAKLIKENRWYHFDDHHVSPVGEAEIKTSAAYLLFYQRVKSDPNVRMGETSQSRMAC